MRKQSDEVSRKLFEMGERQRLLNNMIAVHKSNTRLVFLTPEDRAKNEIKSRVMSGLTESQKELAVFKQDKLLGFFKSWFENNKAPYCPISNWIWFLKEVGVDLRNMFQANFYQLVARNDGAVARWQSRTGEWWGWDNVVAQKELERLKEERLGLLKRQEVDKKGGFDREKAISKLDGNVLGL